jgi:hydroxyacylglutathione hydrolase
MHATTWRSPAGHLRGSVNVGLGGRFAEYTGEVMKPGTPDRARHPAGPRGRGARAARPHRLRQRAWARSPSRSTRSSRTPSTWSAVAPVGRRARERIESVPNLVLVDVRNPGEVQLGSIAGARHISLPALLNSLDQLDPAAPTVVFCAGGYRSAIASSLLRSHGFTDVSD